MPLLTIAQRTGIFGSADLAMLSRVYSQAAFLTSSEGERACCARAVISLFRSGVSDEATLVRMASERVDASSGGEGPDQFGEDELIARIWAEEMFG